MHFHTVRVGAIALAALLIPYGASAAPAPGHGAKRPHYSSTCSGAGANSFVGVNDGNGTFGNDTAILGGKQNVACDDYSAVGAGVGNQVSSSGADQAIDGFVGGGWYNLVSNLGGFIGGGERNHNSGYESAIGAGLSNVVSGADAFVGAGQNNQIAGAQSAAIFAGEYNEIAATNGTLKPADGGFWSAIGGGYKNLIEPAGTQDAEYAFIGGGYANAVSGNYGVVAGGESNVASGYLATIPGGYHNAASGITSFAAGFGSYAVTNGSFVWSDYSPSAAHLAATKPNQFLARASGGVAFYSNAAMSAGVALAAGSGTWSSLSDRRMKDHITGVDGAAILAKLDALPVSEWSYTSERGVRHVGPMAQDFYSAFQVGEDDRHITTIDEDGVALAAVKALHAQNAALRAHDAAVIRELRHELDEVKRSVAALARR